MKFNFSIPGKKRAMTQEQNETISKQENPENQPLDEKVTADAEAEAYSEAPAEEPVIKLEKELAELKSQHMRLYAEFDNYKKRSLKERMDLIRSAGSDMIISLLPVLDDFDRALKAVANDGNNPMKEGVLLIHNKLSSLLEQKGLKPMNAAGTEFDSDLHEAITNVPVTDESQKGKVIEEVEKGYYLNDKVIRYAKVVVGN